MYSVGIYRIKNLVNGHCYIGQSANLIVRRKSHFNLLKTHRHSCIHLQRAWDKYGKDNFIFEPILFCEPKELTYYEQTLVDLYKPQYNILKICVTSPLGTKATPEHRKKLSLAKMGKPSPIRGRKLSQERINHMKEIALRGLENPSYGIPRSEEVKRKISESKMGDKHPFWGKHIPEEWKKKMSITRTGVSKTEEHKKKISIALTGIKRSKETKLLLSITHKGKKPSLETRKKMSESQKRRQAGLLSS